MVLGTDMDVSGKLDTTMEVSPSSMENGNPIKLPEEKLMICASNCEDNSFGNVAYDTREERMMTCASNCEDNTFDIEVSPVDHDHIVSSKVKEDADVDIVEDVDLGEKRVVEVESHDVTESSSSFGFTDSEIESSVSSGVEVESQVRNDSTSSLGFGGCDDLFRTRKKKLTAHWRRFIRPLMWRCKWLELQMRELHSQASKYDKELAECDRRKQRELEKYATIGTKSAPFDCQNQPVKVMKRKKRKRVEEAVDLASYNSCHNLFSYYASKRSFVDSAYLDDDHANTEKTSFGSDEFVNGEWSSLDFKDSDALASILQKIEEAQLQVRQLKVRMDKVVRENAAKFTTNNSSFPMCKPIANPAPNSGEKLLVGSSLTTSRRTSEKKLVVPETAVSSHGEVTPLPGMIESTDPPDIGGKCGKIENEILIHGRPVKQELDNTEEVGVRRVAQPEPETEGIEAGNVRQVLDSNSPGKTKMDREQSSSVKILSISKLSTPKDKRKRGRRKARSGGSWSRRSSG